MAKRNNVVRVHGLDSLNEAMAIKDILDKKGLGSTVTMNPGNFEYHIKVQGHKPFIFDVILPLAFDLDEARAIVNDAVVADDEHLEEALLRISSNPCFSIVSEELIGKIGKARAYVKEALSKEPTVNDTPQTSTIDQDQNTMNTDHFAPDIIDAIDKAMEEVSALQETSTTPSNQPSEESKPIMTNAATTETNTRSVTQSPADQTSTSSGKILGMNKKHLYMGAAVAVAVGLGVLGWKNADKITSIFSRNPV